MQADCTGGTQTGYSCVDNNDNALTAHADNTSGSVMFYGIAITGATSYTVRWTGNTKAVAGVMEFSSVSGFGNIAVNSNTSNNPSVSLTTSAANSFVVAGLGQKVAAPSSSQTGTMAYDAEQAGTSAAFAGVYNSAASSGTSVTCSVTITTSQAWVGLAVELLATVAAAGGANQLMMMGCGG